MPRTSLPLPLGILGNLLPSCIPLLLPVPAATSSDTIGYTLPTLPAVAASIPTLLRCLRFSPYTCPSPIRRAVQRAPRIIPRLIARVSLARATPRIVYNASGTPLARATIPRWDDATYSIPGEGCPYGSAGTIADSVRIARNKSSATI